MKPIDEQEIESLLAELETVSYSENPADKEEFFDYPALEEKEGDEPIFSDVDVPLEIVFGKKNVQLTEFMKFKTGSLITLDKTIGEPVSIEANGKTVGYGEVVVVEGCFGVKITETV